MTLGQLNVNRSPRPESAVFSGTFGALLLTDTAIKSGMYRICSAAPSFSAEKTPPPSPTGTPALGATPRKESVSFRRGVGPPGLLAETFDPPGDRRIGPESAPLRRLIELAAESALGIVGVERAVPHVKADARFQQVEKPRVRPRRRHLPTEDEPLHRREPRGELRAGGPVVEVVGHRQGLRLDRGRIIRRCPRSRRRHLRASRLRECPRYARGQVRWRGRARLRCASSGLRPRLPRASR